MSHGHQEKQMRSQRYRPHPYNRCPAREHSRYAPPEQRRLPDTSVVQQQLDPPVFITNDDVHGAEHFELEKNKSDYYLYRYISDKEHEYIVDTSPNQVSNMAITYESRSRKKASDPHHSSHIVQGYQFRPSLAVAESTLNWYPVPRHLLSERTIRNAWRHRIVQEAFRCKQSFTASELSQMHMSAGKLRASDVVEVQYPAYASGLQWHVASTYPKRGTPLTYPELSRHLVEKLRTSSPPLRFTAEEWSSFSFNKPLTLNDFVVGNGVVFQPGFGDEDKNPCVFYRPHLNVEQRNISFAIFSLDQALRTYNMSVPGPFEWLEILIDRYKTEEEFFVHADEILR